jgi:hypothetical protein
MWNHPIHLHGVQFQVTGSDGGAWPETLWRSESTEIVGVGQMRDIEFTAVPGDWAFHCHMAHHTMNAMGHDLANPVGVKVSEEARQLTKLLPGYQPMGEAGMAEHAMHVDMGHHEGPENTLPMMVGQGPYGPIEMGGMFTMVKVRDDLPKGQFSDPGWFKPPSEQVARAVDPGLAPPLRRSE